MSPAAWVAVGAVPPYNRGMSRSSSLGRTKAVVLDLWYTTWYHRPDERADYHRAKRRAWERCLQEAGASRAASRNALDRLRTKLNRIEERAGASTLADQARWVGRWLGVHVDAAALVQRLDRALARTRLHPTPGVRPFLSYLRARGMRIGMVSNICDESPGGIRARLRREGLLPFFDAIVLSSEFGRAKPDPGPFRACFHRLGVPPSRALFVGDLPVDHLGAERSGARFVLYLGVDRESPGPYRAKRRTEPRTTPRATSWVEIRRHYLTPRPHRQSRSPPRG